MNIQIKVGPEEVGSGAVNRAEKRLHKLARFFDESKDEVQVLLDYTRESGSATSEAMWRASVRVSHAGNEFYAAEAAATPELAADEAIGEVSREIKRARGKRAALVRRGGALLKRMLRRG